jgi:tetratricopeptide (TPR) repeat protein
LLANWPFRPADQDPVRLSYNPANKMQEYALAVFNDEKSWEVAHVELAEYYAGNKQLELAALEYVSLVRGTPYNISPYLRLGIVYLESGRYDDALNIFLKSLEVEETATANKWIGSIYANLQNPLTGLPYLERAFEQDKNDPEVLYNLSVNYAMLGRNDESRAICKELKTSYPDHPGVQKLWRQLNRE